MSSAQNVLRRSDRPRHGFVLIPTVGVIVLFTLWGSSLVVRGIWQSGASIRAYHRTNALHLADAAVEQAVRNLRTLDTADDVSTATLSTGNFQIDAVQSLGPALYRVTAHGTSQQETRRIEAVFRLQSESIFQFALFGDQHINVSGNAITDSYRSSLGAYNSDPGPGYNAGHNGDAGTNTATVGGMTVGGSIFIDGQVAVGYNASDPQAVVVGYNPAFITGGTSPPSDTQDIVPQSSAFPMPPVSVPAGLTCSNFTVGNNAVETLSPTGGPNGDGVYCFHNLTLQGGGMLTTSGPVTVYITGEFDAKGNSLMGVPSDPEQMLVLMTPTGDVTIEEGTLTGSTGFYGALYGPNSTIDIQGNAEVFGSIIAQTINVTGSAAIHYDEALTDLTKVTNTFKVTRLAWREL